jgi:hypothetical protein
MGVILARRGIATAMIFGTLSAAADDSPVGALPYSTRTRPYSAYSGTVRGDPRTVGMAGATVGLADTFTAAGDNPAGLAMTLSLGDTHASTNRIYDGHLQDRKAALQASSLGAALSIRDFGFSIGLTNVWDEGQFYRLPSLSSPQWIESYVREYRIAGAYRFNNQLSVGAQLRFADLMQGLGPEIGADSNPTATDSAIGLSLGVLYRLPRQRLLFGASWSSGMTLDARDSIPSSFSIFPGYVQPVLLPSRLSLGMGYVPNRLLRADFTLQRVGATPGAALLSNQSRSVGAQATLEPHFGVAYTFADFTPLRGLFFAGTYLQPSRIESLPMRLHLTFGLEAKWSFVNFGFALDRAASYENYLASIGVDPFRIMELLDVIPRSRPPAPRGLFPNPWYESDEGLAAHLRNTPENGNETAIDPFEVGRKIPKKLERRVRDFTPGQVLDTLQELPEAIQKDIDDVRDTMKRQDTDR